MFSSAALEALEFVSNPTKIVVEVGVDDCRDLVHNLKEVGAVVKDVTDDMKILDFSDGSYIIAYTRRGIYQVVMQRP